MNTSSEQKPQLKYSPQFILDAEEYLASCKQNGAKPSLSDFAQQIGIDEETLKAWANKKIKDAQGNLTNQHARPEFLAVLKQIRQMELAEEVKPVIPQPVQPTPQLVQQEVKTEQPQQEKVVEKVEVKQEEKKKIKLNPQQELFCKLYASDREFFANGTQSYIEAYRIDIKRPGAYNSARATASELLTNINILERINQLLEVRGLNDVFVDKQLEFVITQNADFPSKIAGIREYNKLRQRITEKIDHTTKGKELPTPIYGGRATE